MNELYKKKLDCGDLNRQPLAFHANALPLALHRELRITV